MAARKLIARIENIEDKATGKITYRVLTQSHPDPGKRGVPADLPETKDYATLPEGMKRVQDFMEGKIPAPPRPATEPKPEPVPVPEMKR